MRYIQRDVFAPYESYLKHSQPDDWDSVDSDMKLQIRQHILTESQFGISAYTERIISNRIFGLHIDHFIKREYLSQKESLDYSNFFVDEHAGVENYGADYKDNSKKTPIKSKTDNLSIINPSLEDPHHYFSYSTDGNIYPRQGLTSSETKKANITLQSFNLSHTALLKERSDVIHTIINYKHGGLTSDQIKEICLLEVPFRFPFPSLIEYLCNECFDVL